MGDSAKHCPNVGGGFGFREVALGKRTGQPALGRTIYLCGRAAAQSRNTALSLSGSASTPQRTLPIFSGKTNRKRPARVFLSACIAAIKRATKASGHPGSGLTRAIRLMMPPQSLTDKIPDETARAYAA